MRRQTPFMDFLELVVRGDLADLERRLADEPALATTALGTGASRSRAVDFFLRDIAHYVYSGDTALHVAAAAFRTPAVQLLLAHGANSRARNRRGAEPLHYAADANRCDPAAQAETIRCLASSGADPNARDRSGVAPLHRAVRTRSLAAVRALLDAGADVKQRNGAGSTALHLAVQTTGRGGSGSAAARAQQLGIVKLLIERGAGPGDRDGRGKRVSDAVTSERVRVLLTKGSRRSTV